jgi:hypothetical protein
MFELEDFVFYSQLLTFEIGEHRGVRQGAADFPNDLALNVGVPGTKRFNTILKHQASPVIIGREQIMVNPNRGNDKSLGRDWSKMLLAKR